MVETKQCRGCKKIKPIDEFHNDKRNKSTGKSARCGQCTTESVRRWRERHPEEALALSRRTALKYQYGLTPEQWDQLLADQNGGCAVCGTTEPGGVGRFHVDHNHACCPGSRSCGECVRGLLCHYCNVLLGYAQDDPARLERAATYLIERNIG